MGWKREFDTDFAVPPQVEQLVAHGKLRDDSWHNDVCPRFVRFDNSREIWCDHPDADMRELPLLRYRIVSGNFAEYYPDQTAVVYEGDDISAALDALFSDLKGAHSK